MAYPKIQSSSARNLVAKIESYQDKVDKAKERLLTLAKIQFDIMQEEFHKTFVVDDYSWVARSPLRMMILAVDVNGPYSQFRIQHDYAIGVIEREDVGFPRIAGPSGQFEVWEDIEDEFTQATFRVYIQTVFEAFKVAKAAETAARLQLNVEHARHALRQAEREAGL